MKIEMFSHDKIIQAVKNQKEEIIDNILVGLAKSLISRIDNDGFSQEEELNKLLIEKIALNRASEVIDIVISRL